MPDLRKDPIVNRWVIIATGRVRRPHGFEAPAAEPPLPAHGPCPFCPGHEDMTPPEIVALRPGGGAPNRPGWQVRVFPNKFPALRIEGELDREGEGVYDRMNGIGAHEVVVETSDHARDLANLSVSEIEAVLRTWQGRMVDLRRDARFRYIMVFKNHGSPAGASISHTHSQIIALPVVPKTVIEEMDGALAYYQLKERCVFCDIVKQERRERTRLVHENDAFVVFEPYAPKFPFETWIAPRQHRPNFETAPPEETTLLAEALRTTLGKLNQALDAPPYNVMLHSAPLDVREAPHYHWHIEIMPTLGKVAGFEWGSGFYINPTPPEEAARFLRELP